MQWINQADLRSWANRIGAREQFPVMIRDLILASAQNASEGDAVETAMADAFTSGQLNADDFNAAVNRVAALRRSL